MHFFMDKLKFNYTKLLSNEFLKKFYNHAENNNKINFL